MTGRDQRVKFQIQVFSRQAADLGIRPGLWGPALTLSLPYPDPSLSTPPDPALCPFRPFTLDLVLSCPRSCSSHLLPSPEPARGMFVLPFTFLYLPTMCALLHHTRVGQTDRG